MISFGQPGLTDLVKRNLCNLRLPAVGCSVPPIGSTDLAWDAGDNRLH
jgi:hypothetical protein